MSRALRATKKATWNRQLLVLFDILNRSAGIYRFFLKRNGRNGNLSMWLKKRISKRRSLLSQIFRLSQSKYECIPVLDPHRSWFPPGRSATRVASVLSAHARVGSHWVIGWRRGDTVERHWCFLVPAGTTVTHTCMRLRVVISSIRTHTFSCWCTAFRGTAHACPPWLQSGSDRVSFAFASRLRVRVLYVQFAADRTVIPIERVPRFTCPSIPLLSFVISPSRAASRRSCRFVVRRVVDRSSIVCEHRC